MLGLGLRVTSAASLLTRLQSLVPPTMATTRTDSQLPGSAVTGFMAAAQAIVDLINAKG